MAKQHLPPADAADRGEKFFAYASSDHPDSVTRRWLGWLEANGCATGYIRKDGEVWRPGVEGVGVRTAAWNEVRGKMRIAWHLRPSDVGTEYANLSSLAEALKLVVKNCVPKGNFERSVRHDLLKALAAAESFGIDAVGGSSVRTGVATPDPFHLYRFKTGPEEFCRGICVDGRESPVLLLAGFDEDANGYPQGAFRKILLGKDYDSGDKLASPELVEAIEDAIAQEESGFGHRTGGA